MAKYTLLLNGMLKNNETGQHIPGTRGNYISDAAIGELLKANCATQDASGLIAFIPDDTLLDAEKPVVDTLDQAKMKAHALIDVEAGKARSRYITITPGQEATYISKGDQAEKFAAAGYDLSTLGNYVWIVSECRAQEVAVDETADITAVKNVVDTILSERASWFTLGSKIEEIRRTAKIKVSAQQGTTPSEIVAAKASIKTYTDEAIAILEAI